MSTMRRAHKVISYVATIATFALTSALAMSTASAEDQPGMQQQAAVEKVERGSITATVESVDKKDNHVTLRKDDGTLVTFKLGKDAKLGKIKKGDQVKADYVESLALAIAPPGEKPKPAVKMEEAKKRMPDGVELGRQITATAEVVDMDTANNKLTIRGPKGNEETINIVMPAVQQALKDVKPGDQVSLIYTEAVAINLTPASA